MAVKLNLQPTSVFLIMACEPLIRGLRRSFHSSRSISFARKVGKGGGKKGAGDAIVADFGSDDDDEKNGTSLTLPNLEVIESKMNKKLDWLVQEYKTFRGGAVSADMFNNLNLQAYGSRTILSNVAQSVLRAPNKINISVFDPMLVQDVAKTIRDSAGGTINPVVQGANISVNVPKPSKEQRESTIKIAGKLTEKIKQDIRKNRKDALDDLKKIEDNLPKDDFYRLSKEIDAVTEKVIKKVTAAFKEKEKDILN